GQLAPDAAQQQLAPYTAELQALAGRQVTAGGSLLSFGAGNQIGTVSIGTVARRDVITLHVTVAAGTQQHYHLSSSNTPAAPAFQTPYPPNPLFTGRAAELDNLAAILLDPSAQTAVLLPAITRLGRIGKTQLAAEFTHRYRECFLGGILAEHGSTRDGVRMIRLYLKLLLPPDSFSGVKWPRYGWGSMP
ncbi:MAG: hypothetical protein MI924_10350, partial [Chloroflexales bacterium]|nr:hypothetical protein [Chloroflexales bacterium]